MIEHLETTSGLLVAENIRAGIAVVACLDASYVASVEADPGNLALTVSPFARDSDKAWKGIAVGLNDRANPLPPGVNGRVDTLYEEYAEACRGVYKECQEPELPEKFPRGLTAALSRVADYVEGVPGEIGFQADFPFVWLGAEALAAHINVRLNPEDTYKGFLAKLGAGNAKVLEVMADHGTNDILHFVEIAPKQVVRVLAVDPL